MVIIYTERDQSLIVRTNKGFTQLDIGNIVNREIRLWNQREQLISSGYKILTSEL